MLYNISHERRQNINKRSIVNLSKTVYSFLWRGLPIFSCWEMIYIFLTCFFYTLVATDFFQFFIYCHEKIVKYFPRLLMLEGIQIKRLNYRRRIRFLCYMSDAWNYVKSLSDWFLLILWFSCNWCVQFLLPEMGIPCCYPNYKT